MKTKILVLATLVGAAALSANAGVSFNFSFGLPAAVVVSQPVVVAQPVPPPLPVVVETVPVCPSVDYVWVGGCWSYRPTGYVWTHGSWCQRSYHGDHGHFYGGHRW
jgi:hypothetical protein